MREKKGQQEIKGCVGKGLVYRCYRVYGRGDG